MGSEAGHVKAPINLTDHAITDFDLYLFGEGKHERIYDKLGAHLYTSAAASVATGAAAGEAAVAATGTRFAVWAPNAERVSVVGAFNQWNGDTHVMHVRGSSGIWELAIPGIGAGTAYKYEIRDRAGHLFVKADPYGFAMQLRPENCSVVTSLDGYAWQDSQWLVQRERSREDRREVQLRLTDAGIETVASLVPTVVDKFNFALRDFSRAEASELNRLLIKLITSLDSASVEPGEAA